MTKSWNGLSQEIINSKTTDTFKRAFDQEQGLIRRRQQNWLLADSYKSTVNHEHHEIREQ